MADKDPFEMSDDELASELDHDDIKESGHGDEAFDISGDDHESAEGADSGDEADREAAALRREVEALRREQEAARVAEQQAQARARVEAEQQARARELEQKEQALTAKRRKALEEDDLDAFDQIDAELTDVRLERRTMASANTSAARPAEADSGMSDVADPAKAWAALHPEFFTDPAFKQRALAINEALLKEGYRVDDPKLYRELSERLAKPEKDEKPRQRAGQVAGVSRGNAVSGARPASQRKLTSDDLRSMRRYNMDPQNPAHRRAWANRNAPL